MSKPKVLLLDIETSFLVAGIWGRFNQNLGTGQIIQDSYVLNWSAKWLDDEYIYSDALFYHKRYKKDPSNDIEILKSVWDLMDEADYIIAHNGARFDCAVLNSRFIQQGMKPPSTYQVIDTLHVARRAFKFTSNKLDDLGKYLKVGKKLDTGGFQLWKDIIVDRNIAAFKRMVAYCEQDVLLLEKVYLKLRPWDKKHPSTVLIDDKDELSCNVCGSHNVVKNGSYATTTQVYQKYKCQDCGHSLRSRKSSGKARTNLLRSI